MPSSLVIVGARGNSFLENHSIYESMEATETGGHARWRHGFNQVVLRKHVQVLVSDLHWIARARRNR